jgi:hypothetical protein
MHLMSAAKNFFGKVALKYFTRCELAKTKCI